MENLINIDDLGVFQGKSGSKMDDENGVYAYLRKAQKTSIFGVFYGDLFTPEMHSMMPGAAANLRLVSACGKRLVADTLSRAKDHYTVSCFWTDSRDDHF